MPADVSRDSRSGHPRTLATSKLAAAKRHHGTLSVVVGIDLVTLQEQAVRTLANTKLRSAVHSALQGNPMEQGTVKWFNDSEGFWIHQPCKW